jgi:hypothetical protein
MIRRYQKILFSVPGSDIFFQSLAASSIERPAQSLNLSPEMSCCSGLNAKIAIRPK